MLRFFLPVCCSFTARFSPWLWNWMRNHLVGFLVLGIQGTDTSVVGELVIFGRLGCWIYVVYTLPGFVDWRFSSCGGRGVDVCKMCDVCDVGSILWRWNSEWRNCMSGMVGILIVIFRCWIHVGLRIIGFQWCGIVDLCFSARVYVLGHGVDVREMCDVCDIWRVSYRWRSAWRNRM